MVYFKFTFELTHATGEHKKPIERSLLWRRKCTESCFFYYYALPEHVVALKDTPFERASRELSNGGLILEV